MGPAGNLTPVRKSSQSPQPQVAELGAISSASSSSSSGPLSAQAIYSAADMSVVTVQGDQSSTVVTLSGPQTAVSQVLGSGSVTSYQGSVYVVTNYHVVEGDSNLTVTFADGNAYQATIVGTDPYSDLAVLSVSGAPSSGFAPLAIVSSANLSVGQQVYAIGNPYGLSGSMTGG
jgi:S1-C subfamily serine protease